MLRFSRVTLRATHGANESSILKRNDGTMHARVGGAWAVVWTADRRQAGLLDLRWITFSCLTPDAEWVLWGVFYVYVRTPRVVAFRVYGLIFGLYIREQ